MIHQPSPQRTPATALAQLLIENPQLPPINWTLTKDGLLAGSYTDAGDGTAVFDAYEQLLGGGLGAVGYEYEGARRISHYLHTTWRDVPISVMVHGDVPDAELDALEQGERDGRAAA